MTAVQQSSALILSFPATPRVLRRLAEREPWSRLEREAREGNEAASGIWYHDAAIRTDATGRDA